MNKGSKLLQPAALKKGDTIAVISPGRWMPEEELFRTADSLERLGFHVRVHPQNLLRNHQFAGTVEQRLQAFHEVWAESDTRAIMLAKAGYGCLHLLDRIDYSLIVQNPKIFIGYSDATALLIALHTQCDLVTFHGPMLYDLRQGADELTWYWFQELLVERKKLRIDSSIAQEAKVLRPGTGVGRLLGGNLTLLANLIGTKTDFEPEGRILFLEDYDEKLYSIDRLMLHLRRAGRLANISGIIIGDMSEITDSDIPFGASVDDLVVAHCEGTSFPIITHFPFGHGSHQLTLPIGGMARLEATKNAFSIELAEASVV